MKYILLILLPFNLQAQSDSLQLFKTRTALYDAGVELTRYNTRMNTGLILSVAGLGVTAISAGNTVQSVGAQRGKSFTTAVGVTLGIAGFITMITAHSHVGKAGRYLKEGGIIVIPLDSKKKK